MRSVQWFAVAVIVQCVELAGGLQCSITENHAVCALHFSGDAVHLVAVALDVVHGVQDHYGVGVQVLLGFELQLTSGDLLLVLIYMV